MKDGKGLLSDLFRKGKDVEEEEIDKSSYTRNALWKASLEILSKFPLSSIDSKSGIIITDWYSSEKRPSERFKITVLILSKKISADSVQVKIHKQIIKNSRWVNLNLDSKKNLAVERKIIQRAVEVRARSS